MSLLADENNKERQSIKVLKIIQGIAFYAKFAELKINIC